MHDTMVRPGQVSMVRTDAALSDGRPTAAARAWRLVERWESAWNDHDLDAILECYRDDVELRSPFVRWADGADTGLLRGKAAVGEYFASALDRFPDLRLDVRDVVVGPDRVTVYHVGVSNFLSIETMFFDGDGCVRRVDVQYRASGV
ncbi:MAG: nuclear transport factor 2 family protein [Acidimicrobiales bacterium]